MHYNIKEAYELKHKVYAFKYDLIMEVYGLRHEGSVHIKI